jgi:drug/metabolite transporter (DMT)-like permease
VLIAFSVITGERVRWPPQLSAVLAWICLVIFGSIIAYSAYMTLLANTRPALATSNSFINPVIAMFLGVSIGGEMVTRQEWLAVGIIVLGVTVLILGRR